MISLDCLSVCFGSSLSFPKTAILKSLSADRILRCRSLCVQLPEGCHCLMVSCYLVCVCVCVFFEVLHCFLHIWSTSYLLQSLLSLERDTFCYPCWDSEAILNFCGYTCFMLLAHSCGRILKFICLLWNQQWTRLRVFILFCFPKDGIKAWVCGVFWPADSAGFLFLLTSCFTKLTHSAADSIPRELAVGWECVWLRHMEHCGYLWAIWGICRWNIPSSSWKCFLIAWVIPLASISLWCPPRVRSATPPPLPVPHHVSHDSVLWMAWEWNEPLWQCPTQPEKLGAHSHTLPFPLGYIMGPGKNFLRPKPWHLRGRVI